jgi:hypothetical protein
VITTLGLAIAANTTLFSFVNTLSIRPFTFRDVGRLALIRLVRAGELVMMSMREASDIREQVNALEDIAARTNSDGVITTAETIGPRSGRPY